MRPRLDHSSLQPRPPGQRRRRPASRTRCLRDRSPDPGARLAKPPPRTWPRPARFPREARPRPPLSASLILPSLSPSPNDKKSNGPEDPLLPCSTFDYISEYVGYKARRAARGLSTTPARAPRRMRGIPPSGIMVQVGGVKIRLVLQMKERRTSAPLCGPGELDRARYQKRQGDPPAYRQRRRDSREAWVDVGASVLDRRSLRHGHHLRGAGRRSP